MPVVGTDKTGSSESLFEWNFTLQSPSHLPSLKMRCA
jgi:hypothetical protein